MTASPPAVPATAAAPHDDGQAGRVHEAAGAGLAGPATPRWLTLLWTWAPAVPAFFVGLVILAFGAYESQTLLAASLSFVGGLAIGLRFHRPLPAWAVSLLVVPLGMAEVGNAIGLFPVLLLVPVLPLAAVATAWPVRWSLSAAAVNAGVTMAVGAVVSEPAPGNVVFVVLILPAFSTAAAWLIGYSLRTRAQYAETLIARARDLERERDERSARAIVEERVRIARDLHDLVSHNVAVMVVQAEGAEAVWDSDRERARGAVHAVAETGRAAMGELRTMLHAMRVGDAGEASLTAQEGLAALPRLVAQLEAAGQPTTVTIDGDLTTIPAPVDGSLLRITQEALTNVLRHAAAGAAHVTVRVDGAEIALTVDDDGVGIGTTDDGAATPGGHGLLGMRERVAVLGGTLDVGPRPGGGTRVDVRIPRA